MKDAILLNINNAAQLERLYRGDKPAFKQAFKTIYPDIKENALASFWNERLNYSKEEIGLTWGKDLVFIIIISLLAGIIAKLPSFIPVTEDFFYPRNIGFILFPMLTAYFAWKNKISNTKIAIITGLILTAVIFINSLPSINNSDTTVLSCIHLLLFLWSILGFAFVGEVKNSNDKRLAFLKYNGDLVVITTLIVIAGGILTGITIGLFSLIGFRIEEFYFENIVVFGLPAAPIIGTYLIQNNPQLVGKVSPVIAKIFSPLVLAMLVIYLVAMVYAGKDPYNDREFLMIFNALLIGVMAIIFFSIAETTTKNSIEVWILLLLSVVTIIVNGIALSAILFRISELGVTPNRVAVLGGNVLILINLLLVAAQLFKVINNKKTIASVGNTIAKYLPVYVIWVILVTFLFPLLFGFK